MEGTPFTIIRDYLAPQSADPTADDTDTLLRAWYGPRPVQSGVATYDIDTANADEVTLVDPVNGTTRLALATYLNCGLLADAIKAVPGWQCQLVGARRDQPTINGADTLLLAVAAATAKTAQGVNIFSDTSRVNPLNATAVMNRSFCIGWEDIVRAIGGRLAHFHERTSELTLPGFGANYDRDPILAGGFTLGAAQPLGNANQGCARITSITAVPTFAGGTTEMHVSKCRQNQDGERVIFKGFTTATEKIIGTNQLGENGHWSGPEERYVIGFRNTSNAISALTLIIAGELGSYK